MTQTLIVVELLGGVFLLLLGLAICALGAWSWSKAIAAAHQAHANKLHVQETRDTITSANDAVEEVRQRARGDWQPPSDDDLREAILASRGNGAAPEQMEFTTLGNEGIEESEPIPSGGFYR